MPDKDVYVQKLHAKIDEWNADLDLLIARLDGLEAQQRGALQKQIEDLQAQCRVLGQKAAALQDSGDSAWEDLKRGMEQARETLETSVKTAKSRFP